MHAKQTEIAWRCFLDELLQKTHLHFHLCSQ